MYVRLIENFYSNAIVNKRISYFYVQKRQIFIEKPIYGLKIIVYYTFKAYGGIDPHFHEDSDSNVQTVNS